MRHHRFLRILIALNALCALVLFANLAPVVSAECPGNRVPNSGFEEGFSVRGVGEVEVANSWTPWWQDGPFAEDGLNRRPEYKPEDASRFGRQRIREGNFSQKWGNNYATHHGGIYQQVGVPANSVVTLRAWAQSWSSSGDDAAVSTGGNYALSVGIDPTGGTDWSSSKVVWSPRNMTKDNWVELMVQARAEGGAVTVYLRGDAEFKLKHNDAYFDDVCLTVQAPPAPPTALPQPTSLPRSTAVPSDTPTVTPSPMPTATATPVPAVIRVLVFDDRNGNSVRDDGEGLLAGARIEVANMQRTPIATYTTDGKLEPYAFMGIKPGSYMVTETDPTGYASTGVNQLAAAVVEGAQLDLSFGDRLAPTSTATATVVPSATPVTPTVVPPTATMIPSPTPTPKPTFGQSVYQVSGLLVALLAVGLLVGYYFWRIRRK